MLINAGLLFCFIKFEQCLSNYIFILNLTPDFNRLGKDNLQLQDKAHLSFGIWCTFY